MTTLAARAVIRFDAMSMSAIAYWVSQGLSAALASVMDAMAERRRRLEALDTFHRIDARTLDDVGIDRARATLAE